MTNFNYSENAQEIVRRLIGNLIQSDFGEYLWILISFEHNDRQYEFSWVNNIMTNHRDNVCIFYAGDDDEEAFCDETVYEMKDIYKYIDRCFIQAESSV